MATGDGFTGLQGLAGWKAGFLLTKASAAPDKNLHPRVAMAGTQPHVIGRALICKQGLIGQGLVDGKVVCIGKDCPQAAFCLAGLQRAVRHGQKVSWAEMQAAIAAIC